MPLRTEAWTYGRDEKYSLEVEEIAPGLLTFTAFEWGATESETAIPRSAAVELANLILEWANG